MRKLLALSLTMLLAPLAAPARAVEPEQIKTAIDRGVAALRAMQADADGTWPISRAVPEATGNIGPTALAGLTLLECDVKPDDKAVQRAADAVRKASVDARLTYAVATSILFLDKLGDPEDVPLIESLMVRLLAGQDNAGGWTYNCPPISGDETRRLQAKLDQSKELRGRRELPKPGEGRRTVKDLPEEIRRQLEQVERNAAAAGATAPRAASDNSNTKFAVLALWVGRRHGLPVDKALARVEGRFRNMQCPDGGWPYRQKDLKPSAYNPTTASMTCAGILAIAIAQGATFEAILDRRANAKVPDLRKDPNVARSLQALAAILENPNKIPLAMGYEPEDLTKKLDGRLYYFLWSVERVAVALDLNTIGKTDWYALGAERLLASQGPDGSWRGKYGGCGADTCFALLFLRRANLTRDLTARIKGKPSERVLTGGIPQPKSRPGSGSSEIKTIEKPLTPRAVDPEVGGLADALVKAEGERKDKLITKMQTEKGSKYTEALATAIPRLEGDTRKKAREALADRLSRMKDDTLGDYLRGDDAEIRRAAALAVAMKESKSMVPALIGLLRDPETDVVRAAHAALKELTGQDFGPAARATREERDEAARKWTQWWEKQK